MSQMMTDMPTTEDIKETEITDEDSPIVRLVNQMIQQAVQLKVSIFTLIQVRRIWSFVTGLMAI